MGRRRAPDPAATSGIPLSLYWGIERSAFRFYAHDPRSAEHQAAHRRWSAAVRAAGYTVAKIREAAETDAGYQTFLTRRDRRARLLADDPDRKALS